MTRALVVDDSLVARAQIKKFIASIVPDIEIDEAKCAQDGVSLVNSNQYDIITVDYNMPGGNGDLVIKQAIVKHPEAKIAMLTANKQSSMQDKCVDLGVTLLVKPDFHEDLSKLISS